MSHRIIIRLDAEVDITDAAIWYQNQKAGLGDEFIAEIHSAIESAAAHPNHYPRFRRKPEVRRVLVKRFPFRIFFVVEPDRIIVIRVLHGARRDREWKKSI